MDQEDTGGEQEKKPTNLEPFHSVTQPADDETVVLMDNILRYPLPESASTVSTHLTWDWHVTATQAMEHAVTSPTTSPLHKMAWLSLRDKDAHCGMERLHFQISIPAAICWPLSSKERLCTSGAEIAMVVAKDRNTKKTNTWHLNWDAVAVQYFVACHHANCSYFLRFHFLWPSVPLLRYCHFTHMELYHKSAN